MAEKLIQQINEISDEGYKVSQELAEIAERKGTAWLALRKECKTNAECDAQWDATADGKRENYLKWLFKGLQMKRGALIMEWKSNNGSF